MPLKPLPFRVVKSKLEAAGFVVVTQQGSHVKFVRTSEDGVRTTIVPRHREIAVGTLRSILNQAGLTVTYWECL